MGKLKDQLAGIAALIATVVAIGVVLLHMVNLQKKLVC